MIHITFFGDSSNIKVMRKHHSTVMDDTYFRSKFLVIMFIWDIVPVVPVSRKFVLYLSNFVRVIYV